MVAQAAGADLVRAEDTGSRVGAPMDEVAFRRFHDLAARPLWAYVARTVGDPALADDPVQEAFYRFLCSGFVGETEAHCKNYLYKDATNLMRNRRRSRGPLDGAAELTEAAVSRPAAARASDLRSDLGRVLPELAPRERRLLWLAHVEGLAHREIGEILGVREGSVRVLLFRARHRLAALLRERGLCPEGTR